MVSKQKGTTKKVDLLNFFGYNQSDKIDDHQMSEMYNMSSNSAPAMTPRKPRQHISSINNIRSVCCPEYNEGKLDSFTGVAENYFYYKGKAITNIKLSDSEKSIADFNGFICIFPDQVYYRYLPDPETGVVDSSLKNMRKSVEISGARFYSKLDDLTGEYSAYIQKSGADFDKTFSVGDSIVISGCSDAKNDTFIVESKKKFSASEEIISVVVNEITSSKISVLMYNKRGELALFQNTSSDSNTITISTNIPNMNRICVHNNRLWGTSKNGEYIYASKLGDCFNFNSFQGISNDSWYSEIGTDGGFTGITSYRTSVVAFKQNYIHHIYGDSPQNFSIPKQTFGGAIDGDSIVELGGVLYYMSADGFYEYSGGEPEKISHLIKTLYKSCKSGTDGNCYYSCVKKADGTPELLVYDPHHNTWHKEDNTDFIGFVKHDEFLYGITKTDMYRFGDGQEEINWCVVSKKFTLDDIDFKGVNTVYIRLELTDNTNIKIYTSRDENDFIYCGEIEGNGFIVHKVPVRFGKCNNFRIMLEGTGYAVVHDIEVIIDTGGRTNAKQIR